MTFTPAEIAAVRAVMPHADDMTITRHLRQRAEIVAKLGRAPRFIATYCSQCGRENGPGDAGTSDCRQHRNTREPS